VYVLARIKFEATSCQSGTVVPPNCKLNSNTGNAVVTAQKATSGSGPFTGVSQHYYYVDENLTNVQSDRETALWAGDCEDPCDQVCQCSELGPDYYWDGGQCVYTPGSPIVIATANGARYTMTSVADGVVFDIDGDGALEEVAWTAPDSDIAFLALDRDGDGKITSGKELFGNHTLPNGKNGFEALRMTAMATNGGILRGSVSNLDPVFSKLLLWTDRNHNGVSEPSELRFASELLSEIVLGYHRAQRWDHFGNFFAYKGWAIVRTAPGHNATRTEKEENMRKIPIWDVYFKVAR
jgi:hypothetical protein